MIRGVRGAVCAIDNTREAIFDATRQLVEEMITANEIVAEDVASIFFTTSPDLNADFPAHVLRKMGYLQIPLMCATEIDVPGGIPRTIRALIHLNTEKKQSEIRHIYVGEASRLRPDLNGGNE